MTRTEEINMPGHDRSRDGGSPSVTRRLRGAAGALFGGGLIALAAVVAAVATATPADATNRDYNCTTTWGSSPCHVAYVTLNDYITNNYAIDYTHNNVCNYMYYSSGGLWSEYCSGPGAYSELVCGSQIYGYGGSENYNNSLLDNLAGNENNYQTCTQ
jgi:hypothetical protein